MARLVKRLRKRPFEKELANGGMFNGQFDLNYSKQSWQEKPTINIVVRGVDGTFALQFSDREEVERLIELLESYKVKL